VKTINIRAAKAHLSGPVEQAAAREKIVIAKAGKPVARLVALENPAFHRSYGALNGRIHASDEFDAPLPPDVLKSFGSGR
jgi:prevent-host-death family protein